MAESISGESVNEAVGVAEIIVETRADHALGQGPTHIANVLAHLIPDVRHLPCGGRAFEVDENRRQARTGIRAQEVQALCLLQLALKALGELGQGIVERCPWPSRLYDHGAEREGRIFAASKPKIGRQASDHDCDHRKNDKRSMLQRPVGKIGADHDRTPNGLTFWPGCNACTPAVTTISPPSSPPESTTVPGSKRRTSTGLRATVMLSGLTTQTAGFLFVAVKALAGSEIPWPWSTSIRPVTVAPSRMAGGGSLTATRTLNVRVTGSACGSTCRTRPFAVTLGSSVRAMITSASPGAVRNTWAGTSKTASQPESRATVNTI